jgi:hypothetical protein
MLTLVSLSLQVIAKVVCKPERQSLVRLVKYAETGIRPQHVCKGRTYSVNETNQVERQDPIRAFGHESPMLPGICPHLILTISGSIVVQSSSNFFGSGVYVDVSEIRIVSIIRVK